jgi:hypothetical protein
MQFKTLMGMIFQLHFPKGKILIRARLDGKAAHLWSES